MLLFLFSAYGKITGFDATVTMMEAQDMPFAPFLLVVGIVLEIAGSILLLVGKKWAGSGAAMLALFTIVATYYFYDFWNFSGTPEFMGMIRDFMKNLSLVGGLICLLWYYRNECFLFQICGCTKKQKR